MEPCVLTHAHGEGLVAFLTCTCSGRGLPHLLPPSRAPHPGGGVQGLLWRRTTSWVAPNNGHFRARVPMCFPPPQWLPTSLGWERGLPSPPIVTRPPPCLCVPSLLVGTPAAGCRAHPTQPHPNQLHLQRPSVQRRSPCEVPGGCEFGEDTSQVQQTFPDGFI